MSPNIVCARNTRVGTGPRPSPQPAPGNTWPCSQQPWRGEQASALYSPAGHCPYTHGFGAGTTFLSNQWHYLEVDVGLHSPYIAPSQLQLHAR